MSNNLKVGNMVNVFDGSWTYAISDEGLVEQFGIDLKKHQHKVIAVNQELPTDNKGFQGINLNNTIIKNEDTGEIVFIHSDYLNKVKKYKKVYTMIDPVKMMTELIAHGCSVDDKGRWTAGDYICFEPSFWQYCGEELKYHHHWHSWMYKVEQKEV